MRDSLVKYGLISWHRIITLFRSTPHHQRGMSRTCGALGDGDAPSCLAESFMFEHSHLHPRKKRILPILCALRIVLLVFWIHFACHAKIMLRFLPPCRSARRFSRLYLTRLSQQLSTYFLLLYSKKSFDWLILLLIKNDRKIFRTTYFPNLFKMFLEHFCEYFAALTARSTTSRNQSLGIFVKAKGEKIEIPLRIGNKENILQ